MGDCSVEDIDRNMWLDYAAINLAKGRPGPRVPPGLRPVAGPESGRIPGERAARGSACRGAWVCRREAVHLRAFEGCVEASDWISESVFRGICLTASATLGGARWRRT